MTGGVIMLLGSVGPLAGAAPRPGRAARLPRAAPIVDCCSARPRRCPAAAAAAPGAELWRCARPCRPAAAGRRRCAPVRAVFEKFSERSIKSVMIAQQEAKNLGAMEVTTEHVLLGLIAEETGSKGGFLNSGLTLEKARAAVEALSGRRKPISTHDNIPFSREVRKTFEAATNECKRSAVSYISPEHILLAMLSQAEATGRRVLESLAVDCDVLRGEALKRLKGDAEEAAPKKRKSDRDGPKALDEFCRDLCEEVRLNRIDPVIGREREVARVMQILARRTKNNPILLGEPGVGKTAIAEGLAYAVVHNQSLEGSPLPAFLRTKRVLQLDVGLLMAGAKERGELENRVTRLIQEARDSGDVILMIDEVHTLVGTGAVGRGGGGGGGLDISNLMKPALARGELQCIGATTLDEHRKHIEKDQALERRFQPVYVLEPSEASTLDILHGLAERYERHHHCVYSEEALEAAVKLSHAYIADRFLPDKAIDLVDEAGSRVRIAAYHARRGGAGAATAGAGVAREDPKVDEYLQVMETKDAAVRDELYEEAQLLRRRQQDYKTELAGLPADGSSLPVVRACDIEAVVASWSGVPVERLTEDEAAKLVRLGPVMKSRVIGQDDAVDSVVAALCRARVGLKDPSRPAAALLLVGPTGVGKTELTKVLAEQYFGTQDAIIRLDMSEYMERHSVSKLIGAPPGYVGYGEGGKLTEAVRRRPHSIVLFDEIEKAHPDVFSILLQILEDGRLTDSQGRTVSFKNTLVLLTSNIGSRVIAATGGGGGLAAFGSQRGLMGADEEADEALVRAEQARMRQLVTDEVKSYFRPELLNRFDEQIVFHKLGAKEVRRVARLMLQETRERVAARGVSLEVGPRLEERVVRDGYSLEYGARPLRQTITHLVDDVLSDALLHKQVAPGQVAFIELSRATGEPLCVARAPGEPLELLPGDEPEGGEEFTVVRAGHDCGVNGEVLLATARDGGGARGPAGGGAAGGGGDGAKSWVLATGGLEDSGIDGSNN